MPPMNASKCCKTKRAETQSPQMAQGSLGLLGFSVRPMDLRLVLVASPILLALGWAAFNVGRAAVGQLQLMIKRSRA